MVLIMLLGSIGIKYAKSEKNTVESLTKELSVPVTNIVDKQMVIKALSENLQVVGLEGEIEKEYTYTDARWFGNKSFEMMLNGTFKMGFDIADIRVEDVLITKDNEIIIKTPKVILISLEIPYDKIEINKEVGLLRKDFGETDRQFLYAKASESVKQEILDNKKIHDDSVVASQNAIINILKMIPDVENVYFR